jgi:hypothetical protein
VAGLGVELPAGVAEDTARDRARPHGAEGVAAPVNVPPKSVTLRRVFVPTESGVPSASLVLAPRRSRLSKSTPKAVAEQGVFQYPRKLPHKPLGDLIGETTPSV